MRNKHLRFPKSNFLACIFTIYQLHFLAYKTNTSGKVTSLNYTSTSPMIPLSGSLRSKKRFA